MIHAIIAFVNEMMGCRQMARHRILTPAFEGSSPSSPVKHGKAAHICGLLYFLFHRKVLSYEIKKAPLWIELRRNGRCRLHGQPFAGQRTAVLNKRHRRLATLARSNCPHTLGLSNGHTQGQINLLLRLHT